MFKSLNRNIEYGLTVLRVSVAALMLTHGYPKLMVLVSGGEIKFADPIGLGITTSFVLTIFAEFFCSIFLLIGLKTRLAAIPLAITMAVAAFIVHGADPWANKEKALLYLVIYLVLIISGGGKLALKN